MEGQVVNVGNPNEVSILELAEKVKAITGTSSKVAFHPRPTDDPQRRCPDISKAKELLRWSPIVTLEEGLRKTVDWFMQYRQRII
jgi:nucleoside-diphosphate-sugar epimerase